MKAYLRMEKYGRGFDYARHFVDDLLKENIPCIFLGDIPESRRKLYFNLSELRKDKYFQVPLGKDIIKSIANKYNNLDLKGNKFLVDGNWTEANDVIFYCSKNMVIVLDYKVSENNQCLLIERR